METNTTQAISFPKPTGAYFVGTTSLYFVDSQREEIYTEDKSDRRELTAKVWYPSVEVPGAVNEPYLSEDLISGLLSRSEDPPQDLVNFIRSVPTNSVANAPVATAESEYPVLIFSPGRTTFPEYSTFLAEELASQGFVVVGINHTYDSEVNVFPDGRVVPGTRIFDEARREGGIDSEFLQLLGQSVTIKAEDARFVLNELEKFDAGNDPTGLFHGKLDLDRVGIYGVSSGGAAAAKALSIDPRFKAGINLDGSLYGDVANASLSQPYMAFINESFSTEIFSDALSRELEGRRQPLFDNLKNEGYSVTILGTTHPHFASDIAFLFPLLRDSGIELAGNLEVNINAFFNGTGGLQINW
ncbi:alpha/beta hydrolase family protein [Iningainema tapete]|uniref:1-alkyl-2-acetylglycerophosphocholine esterase n=1 Tax=Iningainema tapete BLCC-T55 TaxID=2748662 RepID=A0A8J6XIL0_9CYAN|nr:hypothetical protein [Iningainema tapete]MBD2771381.1 hypothetical protein [Iningainema tapete BLCC-T55]